MSSSDSQLQSYGLQRHSDAEKHLQQALLYGLILVFAHLLNIQPSKIDVIGLQIEIQDASVLRGAVALLFLNFAYRSLIAYQRGEELIATTFTKRRIRLEINDHKRDHPESNISERKKGVRSIIRGNKAVNCPYYFGISILLFAAITLALADLLFLGLYLYRLSPELALAVQATAAASLSFIVVIATGVIWHFIRPVFGPHRRDREG